jgi:hypothetical protein
VRQWVITGLKLGLLTAIAASGPRALFLRVLIDKKKDLPYKVIDELVFHFIRVSNSRKSNGHRDTERLPVLWHQSLLSFCQRCVELAVLRSAMCFDQAAPAAGTVMHRILLPTKRMPFLTLFGQIPITK